MEETNATTDTKDKSFLLFERQKSFEKLPSIDSWQIDRPSTQVPSVTLNQPRRFSVWQRFQNLFKSTKS